MKVAVLSPIAWRTPPRHYGPWEQMASNLTEGLVRSGLDVTLFATGDSITVAKLQHVVPAGYEEDRELDAKVAECLHISNLMERADEFDIIHNHYDFLPLSYSKLIGIPIITTIHGFSSEKIVQVYKKYNHSGHYVSISQANRHPDLEYISTVYNGIKVSDFQLKLENQDYLVFFGRIHPDKGAWEAIQIAKRSKRSLIMAGIIQDIDYFKEKIELELNDQIKFIGHVGGKDRNDLLGNAAGLLHPINFEEPFGLSVAEAMCCGTPVIAFNRGSMPELIKHGHTGFICTNMEEASDYVNQLNSIDRINCREWTISQFSAEKMVEDYLNLYEKII